MLMDLVELEVAVEDIVVQGKNEFEKLLLTILRTRINIIRVRSIFFRKFFDESK
jgi:hypothetical protein